MSRKKGFSYAMVAKILDRDISGVTYGIQSVQADNPGMTTRQALLVWLRSRLPSAIQARRDRGEKLSNIRALPVDLPEATGDEDLLKGLNIPDPGDIQLANPYIRWRERLSKPQMVPQTISSTL